MRAALPASSEEKHPLESFAEVRRNSNGGSICGSEWKLRTTGIFIIERPSEKLTSAPNDRCYQYCSWRGACRLCDVNVEMECQGK